MMNEPYRHAVIVCALLLAGCGGYSAERRSEIERLLPADGQEVDVMSFTMPIRSLEALKKFNQAIERNPEVYKSMAKKAGPGRPLSYDRRLGLSPEEFELVSSALDTAIPAKAATATLRVRKNGSRIEFDGAEQLPLLRGVALDLERNVLLTPHGEAPYQGKVEANNDQKMTGKWSGYTWEAGNADVRVDERRIQFGIGELSESGRGILYYRIRGVDAASKNSLIHTLNYDLPKSE